MNKLKLITLFIAYLLSTNSYCQKRKNINNIRIKAYKIAYITDQLNLSTKEAEIFWPVYNAHEKLILKFRIEETSSIKTAKTFTKDSLEIGEFKAKKIIDSIKEIRIKAHQENLTYYSRLTTILPYEKILKLQIAEREFKKKLFEKLRERRKVEDRR